MNVLLGINRSSKVEFRLILAKPGSTSNKTQKFLVNDCNASTVFPLFTSHSLLWYMFGKISRVIKSSVIVVLCIGV